MAGSQHQSTTEAQDQPTRPGLLLVPRQAKRTLIILSLALAGCRGPVNPPAPTTELVSLRFLADSATSPLLHDLASSYRPAHTLITWDIQVGEAQTVLDWLKSGQASFALLDYLPDSFSAAHNVAASGAPSAVLWMTSAAQDGIAIVVNPANPIANLTASQLRSILQGRVTNWQALGGSNVALTVVAYIEQSSSSALIQSIVLGDRRITRGARLATTPQAVIELVSADPGAIGYISMGYLDQRVRTVPLDGILPTADTVSAHQYPISAQVVFAGLKEPGDDAYRAFFTWVQSPEGQAVVRRHYAGLTAQ